VRPPQGRAALWGLRLPAALYGALIGLRNRYYDRPSARRRSDLPVISVGNLTVGGTGKTPLVAWIARRLSGQGYRPAVVSRGYGGTSGRGPRVVSRGDGPCCGWRVSGDEPYFLAATLADVIVIVGSDRVAGAAEARKEGADVIILDDGFQHRRLARDLDLVLIDSDDPFGGRRMLPAGFLREPVSGLSRADIVIVTRSTRDERHPEIERVVRRYNSEVPILHAGHRILGFVDPDGASLPAPRRAVAFCGIGNPERFRHDLLAQGTEVIRFDARPDHHPYPLDELRELSAHAMREEAALVTTEKDMARLEETALHSVEAPLSAMRIEAEIFDPEPLVRRLDETLAREAK